MNEMRPDYFIGSFLVGLALSVALIVWLNHKLDS